MRGLLLVSCALLVACSQPVEWNGIGLPSGTKYVQTEPAGTIELDLPLFVSFEDLKSHLRENLPAQWDACPSLPTYWFDLFEGDPEYVWWQDRSSRSLLWVSSTSASEQKSASIDMRLMENLPRFELLSNAYCAEKDRSLFTPIAVEQCAAFCWASERDGAFNASAWRNGDQALRGSMVADLLCKGGLLGLAEEQVVDLLGPPDALVDNELRYGVLSQPGYDRFLAVPDSAPDCNAAYHELRFNFSLSIPKETHSTFQFGRMCSGAS